MGTPFSIKGSAEVKCSRASLETIVENLVSNAVKYTSENGRINAELSRNRLVITNTVASKCGVKKLKQPFGRGDACRLDFPDGMFDAVTSNYVYHNIMGADRQALLLETLRTLKKGGTFAIHDLMSARRYGDIELFADRLRAMGYREVNLVKTAGGMFMTAREGKRLGLADSTLLTGIK